MSGIFNKISGYRLATVLILGGFLMLCQPFSSKLFSNGFPVLLCGVLIFIVLDHLPDGKKNEE